MSLIIAEQSPSYFIDIVTSAMTNERSRLAYKKDLDQFIQASNRMHPDLSISMRMDSWRNSLSKTLAPSSVNRKLSAVAKLVEVMYREGAIELSELQKTKMVKRMKVRGSRVGRWMNQEEAQRLLDSPDASTLMGARDKALIGVLLGCALRRAETSRLAWSDMQSVKGKSGNNLYAFTNTIGKGDKVHTTAIPDWVLQLITDYYWKLREHDSRLVDPFQPIFITFYRDMKVRGQMTSQTVYNIVKKYGEKEGIPISPHDFRRTFAKLALINGGTVKEISDVLAHESLDTTMRYIQDIEDYERSKELVTMAV